MEDSNKVLEIETDGKPTEKEEEIMKENISVKSPDPETSDKNSKLGSGKKEKDEKEVDDIGNEIKTHIKDEEEKISTDRFLPRQLSHEKCAIGSTLRMADDAEKEDTEDDVDDREREEREERKEADNVYAEAAESLLEDVFEYGDYDVDSEDRVTRNTELLIRVMEESKRKRRTSWKSAWDDDDDQFDENAEMNEGEQFLWAAENNHLDIITELLEKNQSLINVQDDDGYTPLHRASYNGHLQAIELLLKNGADVKARTQDGWQPLHSACKWNNAEAASLLLQNGSDINSQTNGGQTPLHLAASNVDGRDTLELLLMHRFIDINITNGANETAFDIAKRSGNFGYLFDIHAKQLNDFSLHD
ncbi:ankyrin repeat domain-containing protein 49-like [Ptychodera flava]|uniref:ankyrin repeat domain-containing protein 49-like n=1 Tax=Ptychodera flava TaxID=63121 RepID=UPI00396A9A71